MDGMPKFKTMEEVLSEHQPVGGDRCLCGRRTDGGVSQVTHQVNELIAEEHYWRPKRLVTTREELNDVPVRTVVRTFAGTIANKTYEGLGVVFGFRELFDWEILDLPAEVLFDPTQDR